MSKIVKHLTFAFLFMTVIWGCKERYVTYSDAEYVMFADTMAIYPVQKDVEFFSVPVVSTVVKDYDRSFGVEVIDNGSDAIETHHYRLQSNTVTIKAGETRADVLVHGCYDNIGDAEMLGFTLQLVMPDELELPLYGNQTKVKMMKSCPFDINDFTGYCVLTSMFLYNYSLTGSYQRLVYTEKHPVEENTIICRNWINEGYDVTMTFHPEDPMSPLVTMDAGQVASDEGSFFGTNHGDDKILVTNSSIYDSIFYPCGKYLYIWTEMYVENLGEPVGSVGHFYNIMEWVSDEEAERLKKEEGM
ncbi:MAG: DUF4984 domain-containing protein [Bacteroidales bacterium]|nr:DUF4984 domain-containing protein [Bacteroidales bacterium]MBQ8811008.1 DUF4984 domain-containing protein [Bacteroidales bacterium]